MPQFFRTGTFLLFPLSSSPGQKTSGNLFGILANDEKPTDAQLPETGVGLEFERVLSSRFITTPQYGTVCSTVIKIDHQNHCHFEERTFNANGKESDRAKFHFQLKL